MTSYPNSTRVEPTPRPWVVSDGTEILTIADLDLPGVGFAGVIADTHLMNDAPRDIDIANAAFIVRACNAHEELVAALQDISSWKSQVLRLSRSLPDEGRAMLETFSRIEAALAKAKGAPDAP